MSSLPLVSTAARGRFVPVAAPARSMLVLERLSAIPKLAGVTPASRLEVRPAPQMVSCGVREIDALTGGLPRGCLTEICGPASSGRTSVLLAALAAATQRQEVCALVDVSDAFNPHSAAAAGVNFEKMLWVRCGRLQKQSSPQRHRGTEKNQTIEKPVEQGLRVVDLLLQSGGFGLVIIDLGETPLKMARRIPLTSWFRFQRAVEHTPTVLFVISQVPCAQTCASLLLKVSGKKLSALSCQLSARTSPTHAQLLNGLQVQGELLRSRLERKPAGSVAVAFTTKVRAG
jgi:recombination protein RecA